MADSILYLVPSYFQESIFPAIVLEINILLDMTDSIPYLVPTYFQESIFSAITRPKIPALILTLFLFRHMQVYYSVNSYCYLFFALYEKKICLCVCLSENLSVCLGIFLSVYPSICISVCLPAILRRLKRGETGDTLN
jgi:hypothetical protein